MTKPYLRSLLFAMATLAAFLDSLARHARADDPVNATTPAGPAAIAAPEADDGSFEPPAGDPWYSPAPQQRGPRPSTGDGLIFKMRIAPHWFDGDNRFWYRNDLAGGAREFILVDAEHGTRAPAFDHQRLATALSKAAGGQV